MPVLTADSPAAAALAVAAGYLLGSIPTGVLVARARGVDITQAGSGNIGATNVARTLGKKLGVFVLLIDALKGLVPVIVAARVFGLPHAVVAGVGGAAIAGHVFPVWLRFHGGKGVATAFGVFLALSPAAAGIAFALYAGLYAAFRVSSIGSLAAATSVPVSIWLLGQPTPYAVLAALGWLLIVWRHRENIGRLVSRQEGKV